MDEITAFARCRPEVSALDDGDRDRIWQAITSELAASPLAPASSAHAEEAPVASLDAGRSRRPRWRRSAVLIAAGLVVLLGAGALFASLGGRRSIDGSPATDVDTVPSPTLTSTTAATSTSTSSPVTSPASASATLAWQQAADPGSLGRSQASGITAGPGGFVATGMGFDDGRNQGRVWFSADGSTWEEPALDLFDAKYVGAPAATSEAFYVIAGTNPDRLPDHHEGDPGPNDAQLYRSVDGRTWEPWGDQPVSVSQIAAAGDTLLGVDVGSHLFWSADGLTWTPATVPSDPPSLISIGDGNGFTPGPGPWYVGGLRDDTTVLWQSDDGRTWTEIPAPPVVIRPAATDNGLVNLFNPEAQRCNDEAADAFGAPPTDGAEWAERLDAQWQCASRLTTVRLDPSSNSWVTVAEPGPGPTPIFTRLVRLGDVLVAPIIGPDRTLTIWTADQSSLHWEPDASTTISLGDNTGSPQPALIAASGERVVVIGPVTADSTGREVRQTVFVGQ